MEACRLCPRECGAKREEESGEGFCRCGTEAKVARAGLHFWEEPCISGERGSGAVFFCGCSLRCAYCQNYGISHENRGRTVTNEELAGIFLRLQALGAHNINLVTPTHFAPAIAGALKKASLSIPVVYNTSSYEKEGTIDLLGPYVDIYLADIKYLSADLAEKFSGCKDYFAAASKAIDKMMEQKGEPVFDSEGMMKKGVLLRHLVLPRHVEESKRVLDYLCGRYGSRVFLSLMSQYTPGGHTDFPELNRKITKREYGAAVDHALQKGMTNVYLQSRAAADRAFIPAFDLTGIICD